MAPSHHFIIVCGAWHEHNELAKQRFKSKSLEDRW